MLLQIVETALTFVPALLDVPVLGRILIALGFGKIPSDTRAMEELERNANKKKSERATRRERNNRYVIKASDAMQCVEDNIMSPQFALAFVKGVANMLIGREALPGDILVDKIWTCIEENVLRQDTPRVKKETATKFHRPAVGHGTGRQ